MLTFTMTVDRHNTDKGLRDNWLIFFVVQANPTMALWVRCVVKLELFHMAMTTLNEYDRDGNLDHLLEHIQYRSKNPWI